MPSLNHIAQLKDQPKKDTGKSAPIVNRVTNISEAERMASDAFLDKQLPALPRSTSQVIGTLEHASCREFALTINESLQRTYPDTYNAITAGEMVKEAKNLLLQPWKIPGGLAGIPSILEAWYANRSYANQETTASTVGTKDLGDKVIQLATVLGLNLNTENLTRDAADLIENIRAVLKDKSILILGDDIGGFNEVLTRTFGANCTSIELNSLKVWIAKNGTATEDKNPVNIHRGNIWDLTETSSSLSVLLEQGSYDAIVSWFVFNRGSGADVMPQWEENTELSNDIVRRSEELSQQLVTKSEVEKPGPKFKYQRQNSKFGKVYTQAINDLSLDYFLAKSKWLLKPGGAQLHMRTTSVPAGKHTSHLRQSDSIGNYTYQPTNHQVTGLEDSLFTFET